MLRDRGFHLVWRKGLGRQRPIPDRSAASKSRQDSSRAWGDRQVRRGRHSPNLGSMKCAHCQATGETRVRPSAQASSLRLSRYARASERIRASYIDLGVAGRSGAPVPDLLLVLGVYPVVAAVGMGDGPVQLAVGLAAMSWCLSPSLAIKITWAHLTIVCFSVSFLLSWQNTSRSCSVRLIRHRDVPMSVPPMGRLPPALGCYRQGDLSRLLNAFFVERCTRCLSLPRPLQAPPAAPITCAWTGSNGGG